MTLKGKLEKFKSGTVALHASSQGLWDSLMKELERRGYRWNSGSRPSETLGWWSDNTYVTGRNSLGDECLTWNTKGQCAANNFIPLEITEEDFIVPTVETVTAPSETVESIMKSIEEVKADIKFYHELFKRYGVVMTGNLEPAMRAKLESLLKKRVVS